MAASRRAAGQTTFSTLAEMVAAKGYLNALDTAPGDAPRGHIFYHPRSGARAIVGEMQGSQPKVRLLSPEWIWDLTADVDLTAFVNCFVRIKAADVQIEGVSATGERAAGVLTYIESAAALAPCAVKVLGEVYVINAGGVTAYDRIATDAAGKARTATVTSVAGAAVVGSYNMGFAMGTELTTVLTRVFLNHAGTIPTTFT